MEQDTHKEGKHGTRLERLCKPSRSGVGDVAKITSAPSVPGMSRIEASFVGDFFEPHRHDTYALGLTMQGIQAFQYRGERRYSHPGRIIVLHPDELHDGGSGTDQGLLYRMLYLEPSVVREALGEMFKGLPFVKAPILDDPALQRAMIEVLGQMGGQMEGALSDLAASDAISAIAQGLVRHSDIVAKRPDKSCIRAASLARDFLYENAFRTVRSEELEEITSLNRYALSRHFRASFGTSPHRFLLMRRLEFARSMIEEQQPLADVAFTVGFADQSHLTRHFKQAFGVTPGKWAQYITQ
ncbi:AraC family transcriptional regulator [Kiloniella antarctica]|uniref:AraC family transcriptional regulator n=1 Tax=Kiloniella antarctica TaxID=1550907 RepID=A0ABW5BFV3_9PROT